MTRLRVLVFLGLLSAAFAFAQTPVPRQPVILPGRGQAPQPTPTPLPDPSGIYSGAATITDASGTYPQQWRIVVRARPCRDCSAGQYWTYNSNFDGTEYTSGAVERGGVSGIINPDGSAIAFQLQAINCLFVNESTEAPVTAEIWGGSFGQPGGPKLQIRDGGITGSLSGRDCFRTSYSVSVNMQRSTTAVPADCSLRGGWYFGTFANSRGQMGSGWVYLYQSNCYFSTRAEEFGVNIEGIFSSPSAGQFNLSGIGACDASGSGSGTWQPNGTVVGTYTGTIFGGCGLLTPGPISGSFTLVPY